MLDSGGGVAGGMSREDGSFPRETLAERVPTRARVAGRSSSGHSTADLHGIRPTGPTSWTAPAQAEARPVPPPVVKHAWYLGGSLGRQPALLLKWRNTGGHWDGFICAVVPDGDGYALVELWVDARLLLPA